MILDNPELHNQIDQSDILSTIKSLPEYIEKGWFLGQGLGVPDISRVKSLAIIGEGIIAEPVEMLIHILKEKIDFPIFLIQDFQLPDWLKGSEKLLIIFNSPENSEAAISFLKQAQDNNCNCLAVSAAGEFTDMAKKRDIPLYLIHEDDSTFGFIFTFLLSILNNLGLIDNFRSDIDICVKDIRNFITKIDNDVLTAKNPAKRMAIQMVNRWILIIGGGHMYPVARYWMNQINLFAKCWAQCAEIPRMRINLLEGSIFPENMVSHTMSLFLNSSFNNQRLQNLTEDTKQSLMVTGIGTDMINARGENLLSQIFTTILFGDFVAYYLSLAYQVDPSLRINSNNP